MDEQSTQYPRKVDKFLKQETINSEPIKMNKKAATGKNKIKSMHRLTGHHDSSMKSYSGIKRMQSETVLINPEEHHGMLGHGNNLTKSLHVS